MSWYAYPLLVLAGLLVTNGVPHFVAGVSGNPFQSPFADPPGVGESSPLVNVWWGFANLAGGGALLAHFAPDSLLGWLLVGAGVLGGGTFMGAHFGKVRARR